MVESEGGSAALRSWLRGFAQALANPGDADWGILFQEDASWRDLVAFSWTIITVEGVDTIARMARQHAPLIGMDHFVPDPKGMPASDGGGGWFALETATARGTGYARLTDGKCDLLLTVITELKGFEEPKGKNRVRGVAYGAVKNRRTWLDERRETARRLGVEDQPYCLIVGGGQNGLALAARLKQLSVPTLVIDAQKQIGDAWRSRYKSLYLHGPCYGDHFPYLPFPDHWPLYSSKDKMGDWLEIYAKAMELDVWIGTRCTGARYDEAAGEWTVTVEREGETLTLRPRQLVLATGLSGAPHVPDFLGAESFKGEAYHSSKHGNRGERARGKRCVVIGATNSAHDICQDLWEHDAASVTMIQRSPTMVVDIRSSETLRADAPWGNEDISTEAADLMGATMTYRALIESEIEMTKKFAELDADLLRRLEERGFQLTTGEDRSGFFIAYYRSAGGYYIDVGASELVASGEVKVQRGSVAEILPDGVRMEDGAILPADVIVYATGYRPIEEWIGELISPQVQEKVGRCWGLGSGTSDDPGPWLGEVRNMWKPTSQEGLWFQAGSLIQTRFHSLHLALQLKARMEGLSTPVYQAERVMENVG